MTWLILHTHDGQNFCHVVTSSLKSIHFQIFCQKSSHQTTEASIKKTASDESQLLVTINTHATRNFNTMFFFCTNKLNSKEIMSFLLTLTLTSTGKEIFKILHSFQKHEAPKLCIKFSEYLLNIANFNLLLTHYIAFYKFAAVKFTNILEMHGLKWWLCWIGFFQVNNMQVVLQFIIQWQIS